MNIMKHLKKTAFGFVFCFAVLFSLSMALSVCAEEAYSGGEAYAVLQDSGELRFLRSDNSYENGTEGKVIGHYQEEVEGIVYTGFETGYYNYYDEDYPFWKNDTVTSVVFDSRYQIMPESTSRWFAEGSKITTVDLSGLDTSNTVNMELMFYGCSSLSELDLSGLDVSKVENMRGLFMSCESLRTVDLSSFHTSSLRFMGDFFAHCKSLESVNLSGFVTDQVETMDSMFAKCSSLKQVNLSSFSTGNVEFFTSMFSGCEALEELNLNNFSADSATSVSYMFEGCDSLKRISLANFHTPLVQDMSGMFHYCSSLEEVDLSALDFDSVTTMDNMFYYCTALKKVTFPEKSTPKLNSMHSTFEYCLSLSELDLSSFQTKTMNDMNRLFAYCNALSKLDISGFKTGSRTDMYAMFEDCMALEELTLGENFLYWAANSNLPEGYWKNEEAHLGMTSTMLMQDYPSHASEWKGLWTRSLTVFKEIVWTETDSGYEAKARFLNSKTQEEFLIPCEVTKEEIPVSCTTDGKIVYTASVTYEGETYSDTKEVITQKAGHDYQFDHFRWSKDYTSAWAVLKCSRDASHTTEERAEVSMREEFPAPGQDGTAIYTAVYKENSESVSLTIPKEEVVRRGEAYAVVDENGVMHIIRSVNTYSTNTVATVTDLYQRAYSGKVYTGFETGSFSSTNVPWRSETVKKVVFENGFVIHPRYLRYWFINQSELSEVDLGGLDLSKTYAIDGLFEGCTSLTSVDLSNQNTASLTGMSGVFKGCTSLSSVNFAGFNTSKVTTMQSLFENCSALKSMDLSVFSPQALKNISHLFAGCSSLTKADLSPLSGAKLDSIQYLFARCSSLSEVVLGDLDTSNVLVFNAAFQQCSSLKEIDISSFEFDSATKIYGMFSSCSALETLKMGNLNTANVTDMSYLFASCSSLKEIDLSTLNTASATNMNSMFSNCSALSSVTLGTSWTVWKDGGALPKGTWTHGDLSKSETELQQQYPANAAEWAGVWQKTTVTPGNVISVESFKVIENNTITLYNYSFDENGNITGQSEYQCYPFTPLRVSAYIDGISYSGSLDEVQAKLIQKYGYGLTFDDTQKEEAWGLGAHLGTVRFRDLSAHYTVTVIPNCIRNFKAEAVTILPENITSYYEGDRLVRMATIDPSISFETSKGSYKAKRSQILNQLYEAENICLNVSMDITPVLDANFDTGTYECYAIYQKDQMVPFGVTIFAENPFKDVKASMGNTTYKAILWAYNNGIVKGTASDTYSPSDNCTRAQLCVMLWRLAGKPAVNVTDNPFPDVSSSLGNTTYKAILWAYQKGIVKGNKDGTFDPNGNTTRANMAVMLWRMANKPAISATDNPFEDVSTDLGNTTYKAILWAYDVGLTKGTDATHFSPSDPCTRAQLAVFLYRLNNLYHYM